jgi:hypothetical protein
MSYLITEETPPARVGASPGWLIQLDGDTHRNAFLNAAWPKAVLPIRTGLEKKAMRFLRRPEVADIDGLDKIYGDADSEDESSDSVDAVSPETTQYRGWTIRQIIDKIAEEIREEYERSIKPVGIDDVGGKVAALATETVFAKGFDPLEGGIDLGKEAFQAFSQWTEVLPTDQVVASEYSTKGP